MQRFVVTVARLFSPHRAHVLRRSGARASRPVDAATAAAAAGRDAGGDREALGAMALIVGLTEQRAGAYRNAS